MSAETQKTRRYRKRRRAEQERRTRERITEAAVRLHGTIGPRRTTISRIADEAGVQRATVYHHFPDEERLFAACSAHYWDANPRPDPADWAEVRDLGERARRALSELYSFYRHNEPMLELTGRDAELVAGMRKPMEAFLAYVDSAADAIVAGRPERGASRRRVRAAAGHAAAFPAWQSLVRRQGLSQADAVELMAKLIESAAGGRG